MSDLSRATEEAREICFKTCQMSEAEKFSLGENSDRNNLEDDTSRLANRRSVRAMFSTMHSWQGGDVRIRNSSA